MKKTRDILYKRNKVTAVFTDFLKNREIELHKPGCIDTQLYVIVNAVIGVIQTAVLDDFEHLSADELKIQLSDLTSLYLLGK